MSFSDDETNGHQKENQNSNQDSEQGIQKESSKNCEQDSEQTKDSNDKPSKVQNSLEENGKKDEELSSIVNPITAAEDVIKSNDLLKSADKVTSDSELQREQENASPCVSPPTCASPTSLKPTLIEDDDDQFLCPSSTGIQNNISVSGIPGSNNDIPVDKENPMRCVECGEEFLNHFR